MQKQNKKSRRLSTKVDRYKVTNWSEYNRSLKLRGNIKTWIPKKVLEKWYYKGEKKKGSPLDYSDSCIEACLSMKLLFGMGYRQTQGFVESIFSLANIDLKVPSYSVLCKRSEKIKIGKKLFRKKEGEKGIDISADSTGLKVYGEGEWKVRKHGWSKHRTWQKLHLAINPDEKIILGNELTTNGVDDAKMVEPLLRQVKNKIRKFSGDGAYDKVKVYEILSHKKISPIIPPRKGARIKKHGNKKGKINPRDRNIRMVRKYGRAEWKKKVKYHKRSIAETTMFRYKTIIGDKLFSRTFERQKTETEIACKILNIMTWNGMPKSIRVSTPP